jgi:hypothetical protein
MNLVGLDDFYCFILKLLVKICRPYMVTIDGVSTVAAIA